MMATSKRRVIPVKVSDEVTKVSQVGQVAAEKENRDNQSNPVPSGGKSCVAAPVGVQKSGEKKKKKSGEVELSGVEEDPDLIEYDIKDLENPETKQHIEMIISQRNSRQKNEREKRLNELFDKITNGMPSPGVPASQFRYRPLGKDQEENDLAHQLEDLTLSKLRVLQGTDLAQATPTLPNPSTPPNPQLTKTSQGTTASPPNPITPPNSTKLKILLNGQPIAQCRTETESEKPPENSESVVKIPPLKLTSLGKRGACLYKVFRELTTSWIGREVHTILLYQGDLVPLLSAFLRMAMIIYPYPAAFPANAEGERAKQCYDSGSCIQVFSTTCSDVNLRNAFKKWQLALSAINVSNEEWFTKRPKKGCGDYAQYQLYCALNHEVVFPILFKLDSKQQTQIASIPLNLTTIDSLFTALMGNDLQLPQFQHLAIREKIVQIIQMICSRKAQQPETPKVPVNNPQLNQKTPTPTKESINVQPVTEQSCNQGKNCKSNNEDSPNQSLPLLATLQKQLQEERFLKEKAFLDVSFVKQLLQIEMEEKKTYEAFCLQLLQKDPSRNGTKLKQFQNNQQIFHEKKLNLQKLYHSTQMQSMLQQMTMLTIQPSHSETTK